MRDFRATAPLLAINSATVKAWSLEQLVEGCARAGITRDRAMARHRAGLRRRDAPVSSSARRV